MVPAASTAASQVASRIVDALAPVTVAGFRLAARLRGARAFHPKGTTFGGRARFPVGGGPPGFPTGEYRAVVRFSRGAGLPDTLPDVLGIGLRLVDADGPDRHQDLLLASSWPSVAGRRLLRPGRSFTGDTFFSSLLAYEAAGRRVLFAARVAGTEPVELGRIADVLVRGRAVHLLWATPGGDWQALGEVHLGEMLGEVEDARLDLDPYHTVPDLVPVGVLNQLRRPTYAASRAGRHAARGDDPAVTAPTATRPGA
ncbi:MAG TPA: hypothetical protein VFZ79_17145 [Acidimicrobiales bacterium]